jgi:hypothetical protein
MKGKIARYITFIAVMLAIIAVPALVAATTESGNDGFGGLTLSYKFSADVSDNCPEAGYIKFDDTDPYQLWTNPKLYISLTDVNGNNVGETWGTLPDSVFVSVYSKADSAVRFWLAKCIIDTDDPCVVYNIVGNQVMGSILPLFIEGEEILVSLSPMADIEMPSIPKVEYGVSAVKRYTTSASVSFASPFGEAPANVTITFTNSGGRDYGRWWVSSLTNEGFTLNVAISPSSTLNFMWSAIAR